MTDDSTNFSDGIKAWAKLGNSAWQAYDDSKELLEELKPWIDVGQVQIERESDKYYKLLGNNYPIGVNRIDWRGVREYLAFDVFPIDKSVTTGNDKEQLLYKHRNMLLKLFVSNNIKSKDCVVWTGDSTDVSLHMTIETLLELYPLLFSWPQHHYVLPSTGEWCLNYTMEGQLFFGRAENAIVHGYVDLDHVE